MRFYQPTLPFPWPPNLCNFRCLIISVIIPTLLTPIVHLKVRVIRSSQGNNEHIFSSSRSTSIIISIVSSSSPHFGWLEDWNAATCKLEASPVYAWNTRLELTGTTEIYWVHFEDFFGKFGSAPEAHFEDSKVFLVYSPQTEDDRTVANKCYHMQIIQKESNEQLQLYVSDIHFAVWAPSDGCSLKPLKKRTLQVTTHFYCNGKVPFEEAYNEARWQRKSTAVLILLMFLVCGVLENKEARRIQFSTVMFYAVKILQTLHTCGSQFVFYISFRSMLAYFYESSTILRCTNGRIADVFPLPLFFMLLSIIMLAEHCQVWNSWTTAGWLVSAYRKLPSSWNVVIKMVRRGYPASLVHTSIQTC